ncbi:hypothetical protein HDF16_003825 [Granulicella aggregans]|uniref:Uncharacterized protein n=1 Tax=Granulicella aggregans TaxID=474949 RepID=A0A7W8E4Y2_9BACT|nr:hypothetical protein [Granulicella aggregans]
MPYTNDPFAHRINPNGTKDSICKKCFLTVGTGETEEHMKILERDHVCDRWRLEVIEIARQRSKVNQ